MKESPRYKAKGLIGGPALHKLEDAGLTIVYASEVRELRERIEAMKATLDRAEQPLNLHVVDAMSEEAVRAV